MKFRLWTRFSYKNDSSLFSMTQKRKSFWSEKITIDSQAVRIGYPIKSIFIRITLSKNKVCTQARYQAGFQVIGVALWHENIMCNRKLSYRTNLYQ